MSQEFMVYNYDNFFNIFYDKEFLVFNYSKLNCFYINILWLIHYLYYIMFQYIYIFRLRE